MARQANIVSFDDARAASRTRRAQSNRAALTEETRFASSRKGRSRRSSSRAEETAEGNVRSQHRSVRQIDDYQPLRMPSSRADRAMAQRAESFDPIYEDDASYMADERENVRDTPAETKKSKREKRRRDKAKARADRMFAKQIEDNRALSDQEDGAPRAALYEGKMGASHRRSARMQRASTALPQSAKINPAGWFSGINISRRTLRVATAFICLVLVGVFLYTPAQQYYQAQREHDKLAAEYAILEERNHALDSQNTTLSSKAGMEDAVRQKYGYVVQGDQTAVVTGLSDVTTDSARDSENIEANVLASAVKAPEEWYTPYLDAFFGVS